MRKEKLSKDEEIQKLIDEEEQDVQDEKVKKAWVDGRTFIKGKKALRLRKTKNFAFWLSGVFSSFIILLAGILIAVAVLPVSVYFGGKDKSNQYVSEEVSSKSLLSNVQNIQGLTLNDVPVLKDLIISLPNVINSASPTGGEIVSLDLDKLNDLCGSPLFGQNSAISGLFGCIKVVATIDSLGVDLGAIGTLDVMSKFDLITEDAELTEFFANGTKVSNPKLYYYDQSTLSSLGDIQIFSKGALSATSNFYRAFNDDGELCEELKNLGEGKIKAVRFYYPALREIPIADVFSVFDVRFKSITVRSILESFGDGVDEDSPIIKIAGNETISSLGTLTNDKIKMVNVIDPPSTYKPEVGEENYQEKLSAYNKNRKLYDLLLDVSGKESYDELTLDDVANVEFDDAKLNTVIEAPTSDDPEDGKAYSANRKLFDILLTATGNTFEDYTSYGKIKIGDLNSFDINKTKLITVIDPPSTEQPEKNKKIYDMLLDATGKTAYDQLLVGDMNGLDIDKVKLTTVLKSPTSDHPEDGTAYSTNRKLFDILMDATNNVNTGFASYSKIKIGDLNSFNMDLVKFRTVMDSSDNKIIQALINSDDPNDPSDDVTIGNMSVKINDLDVETVYDKHCFTTDSTKARPGATTYYLTMKEGKKHYSTDPTGSDGTEYYIDAESCVWIFLEYEAKNVDYSSGSYVGTGVVGDYQDKGLTIGQLEDTIGNISSEIISATVHQLYECGMLANEYPNIRGMKIIEVVEKLNQIA